MTAASRLLDRWRTPDRSPIPDPPLPLMEAIGATDAASFHAVGDEFAGLFERLGLITPASRVLDVGCGSGRIAIALTKKLSRAGRYEGFDIDPPLIEWAQREITPRFPNFRFQVADVHNERYNPGGTTPARDYRFPYRSKFDFVFLTSVFTHLLPDDLANYTAEISRVLKPGGHALFTSFLLNNVSLEAIDRRQPEYPTFQFDHGIHRVHNPSVPEEAVAYNETFVRELVARFGLQVVEPAYYGSWSGRPDHLSFQDILIVRK